MFVLCVDWIVRNGMEMTLSLLFNCWIDETFDTLLIKQMEEMSFTKRHWAYQWLSKFHFQLGLIDTCTKHWTTLEMEWAKRHRLSEVSKNSNDISIDRGVFISVNAISRRIMDFSVTVYFVILNHLIANSICERNQVLIINIQFDFAYARVYASLQQLLTLLPPWLNADFAAVSLFRWHHFVCVCNSLLFNVFNMIFSIAAAGVQQHCYRKQNFQPVAK